MPDGRSCAGQIERVSRKRCVPVGRRVSNRTANFKLVSPPGSIPPSAAGGNNLLNCTSDGNISSCSAACRWQKLHAAMQPPRPVATSCKMPYGLFPTQPSCTEQCSHMRGKLSASNAGLTPKVNSATQSKKVGQSMCCFTCVGYRLWRRPAADRHSKESSR